MNVLLNERFHTPFETVPFDQIKTADYLEAVKSGIEKAKKNVEEIVSNPDRPTFKNVIEALEGCSLQLDMASGIFFNLHSAESNKELQDLAKEISPLMSDYQNDILLNKDLFKKVNEVYQQRASSSLGPEEMMLLENQFKSFVRNGALLDEEGKKQLREIDQKMSKLGLTFGDNVLAETNEFLMHVEDKSKLAGLPDSALEAAEILAKQKGKDKGWAFSLQFPSFGPFLAYCENRELREKMYRAYSSRAFKGDEKDNQQVVLDIVELRKKRANLLGHQTHAEFVLEERMARTPKKVESFLKEIFDYAMPVAKKEFKELEQFSAKNGGPSKLERWDVSFWSEKLKKDLFSIDDEVLRPYLQLENVVQGAFKVANLLYSLEFKENKNISVYHPDVKAYTVEKNGKMMAIFYADFFPREGKRGGAWMTSYRPQRNYAGIEERPHVSIVCNFTKPTANRPSLLTIDEVLTLFHEFGHSLHGILANTKYPSLSGTNVFWDFVELPSQIMENWVYEKECLDLFASHYQSKEKIPQELIDKIKQSANFQEGMATIRQLAYGTLDMAWHSMDLKNVKSVYEFENEILKNFQFIAPMEGSILTCAFSHIFNGGYSAGYYSYKWAEVLDADAFDYFKEMGIFSKEVATKFHDHILSKGGSEHPADLYRRFRGREPSVKPLLKRAGLL